MADDDAHPAHWEPTGEALRPSCFGLPTTGPMADPWQRPRVTVLRSRGADDPTADPDYPDGELPCHCCDPDQPGEHTPTGCVHDVEEL